MPAAVSHTETNMEISWASLNDVLLLTSSLCVCDLLGTPSKVILDFFSFEGVS